VADAADTIVKVIGGWLSNGAIVATSGTMGCLVAATTIKADTPPEEAAKRAAQGTYGGIIVGSVVSFGLGNWLRAKPDWRPMGITMMVLSFVAACASAGLLFLAPNLISMRYSLPGGWVLGLPSPVQVGVVSPNLVKV
jgi:hypothetical protein